MSIHPYLLSPDEVQNLISSHPDGSLDLRSLVGPFLLPEGITVPGDLILSGCDISRLPAIRVAGTCFLDHSNVASIGAGTVIGSDLIATDSRLNCLERIFIGGSLVASGLRFTRFGEGIVVQGAAVFTDCHLPDFPASMTFHGSLDCTCAQFHSENPFPKGFRVPGDLILDESNMRQLPEGLDCGGLHARYMVIRFSPGTRIRAAACFDQSVVSGIPADISFCGSVYFTDARLPRLPTAFSCAGNLDLSGCSLPVLPEKLRIGGDIILFRSRIQAIPASARISGRVLSDNEALAGHL